MPQTITPRDAAARTSDPISSHLALAQLGHDKSLKYQLVNAAFRLEDRHDAWNDTQLTEMVELLTDNRQQRNVIARSRNLMTSEEVDGETVVRWFEPVGIRTFRSRELMHYRLTHAAKVAE